MSSVGQALGYVGGAVVGSFFGMPMLGAAIGGMIGGAIDPPKGPNIVGPKLDDLSFQSSTLGAPLARGYGTFPVLGNVIWLEGDQYREVTTTEEQGGKGGGGANVESAKYYATFAVSLLRVTDPNAIVSLRRLWIGSNLVFDAGSDNIESILASNLDEGVNFTFYTGSDDQLPNPRWQADKGVNAVSGLPGRCYIVFEDLDLEPYSRSLAMAQIKAEVVVGPKTVDLDSLGNLAGTWGFVNGRELKSVVSYDIGNFDYAVVRLNAWNGAPTDVDFYRHELLVGETLLGSYSLTDLGYGNGPHLLYVCSSDRPVVVSIQGYGDNSTRVRIHSQTGTLSTIDYIPPSEFTYQDYTACLDGDDLFLFFRDYQVAKFNGAEFVARTASTYQINKGGLSENYFFGVLDTGYAQSSTTVYKFDRQTLALVDTFVQSVTGTWAAIQVVSDAEFYTMAENNVYHWLDGVVIASYAGIASFGTSDQSALTWFCVSPLSEKAVFNIVGRDSNQTPEMYLGHFIVDAEMASLRYIVTAECGLAGIASGDLDLTALTDHDVRGYRISERGSVRTALEPLQAAFPFDVAQSGYKLRFVSRGGSTVATIPEEDLGTVATGEQAAVLLPVAREMDTQLPRKVSVRYLDVDREYDMGEQYAERPCNSVNERVVDLPIVMNSQEAARTADVLLSKDWVERTEIGPFALPPTWRNLEAADVVTVEHRGQSRVVRLTRAEYLPDGRISCNAKLTASPSYASTATGEAPAVLGQSMVPLRGTTKAYLLDMPRIVSNQDVPGMAFGLVGKASGWPGGALLRSDDSGNTWGAVGAMNTNARVFIAGAAIASHHGYSIDHGSTLTVTPEIAAHALSSVTEEQLYSQSNLAAYGVDGRWEILAFKTATDNTGSYTLSNFLRGLYGTEWATGLHQTGDLLIMLDSSTLGFFGLPTNAIGAARSYRAITQGASIDSAASVADTYDAYNLKPLSPVDISGERNSTTLEWTITAMRRSRWPVEVFAGVVVPLGESSEAYDLEIWNSGYSTLKRTFSGLTSASTTYTAAQQITDFGSEQQTLYLKWYQLSSVVGRGVASTVSLSRPVADDPFAANVVLLMHMDSATLPDVKGHAITLIGNAQYSTARQKFGSGSALFDGNGDQLTVYNNGDYNFGTGDFTVEAWVYVAGNSNANASSQRNALVFAVSNGSNDTFEFNVTGDASTTGVGLSIYTSAKGSTDSVSASISQGAWHHVAVCRASGTVRFYLDGNKIGADIAYTYACGHATNWPAIGGRSYSSNYYHYLNGNLDEVRVTKAARYTGATYTVPTAPFANP